MKERKKQKLHRKIMLKFNQCLTSVGYVLSNEHKSKEGELILNDICRDVIEKSCDEWARYIQEINTKHEIAIDEQMLSKRINKEIDSIKRKVWVIEADRILKEEFDYPYYLKNFLYFFNLFNPIRATFNKPDNSFVVEILSIIKSSFIL